MLSALAQLMQVGLCLAQHVPVITCEQVRLKFYQARENLWQSKLPTSTSSRDLATQISSGHACQTLPMAADKDEQSDCQASTNTGSPAQAGVELVSYYLHTILRTQCANYKAMVQRAFSPVAATK